MTSFEKNSTIVHMWNCNSRLKHAVKYCALKGISKDKVVAAYKHFSKTYGYSGNVPVKKEPARRPWADDWTNLDSKIQYSPSLNTYWDGKTRRDERSAAWAGWIGAGSDLKKIVATEPR
jgi:hypothetical protein